MNVIEEIVNKYLGVDINEKFRIKGLCYDYIINGKGELLYKNDDYLELSERFSLVDLLNGKELIVKKPYKPIKEQGYWTYNLHSNNASGTYWIGSDCDLNAWKLGNCFRTREEAETKGKEIMEKIKEEYEND